MIRFRRRRCQPCVIHIINIKKYYNYVLKSLKDDKFYIGFTGNLEHRLNEHKNGLVRSTKYRRPFILVYYEVSFDSVSASHREKYLKTTYGHRYLKNRIGESFSGITL
ncbi:MAG: GIY-YIG nuclease family protein [Saprospiraceae bacterium]|nr:GIY-YIG nuclease family protein [Saprospiraceae bacterium]